jgi:cytochrome oxidase Cu insertion factor (SCO1/SenC/PrrC family)
MRLAIALLAALALASVSLAHQAEPLAQPEFIPPAPGTYTLHRILAAPEGRVLGSDGRPQLLSQYTRGKITLLGFLYTTCTDPDGCPRANLVFDELREAIVASPALRGKVRFVTLSFDPANDSPEVMRRYAGSRGKAGDGLPWAFLTTRSPRELAPLLEGFGQDVRVSYDRSGARPKRELSHVLKVFLIDRAGDVREIYSTMFLYPRLVLNDIETLLMEEGGK